MINTLPWGGMVIDCSGEMADDVPRSVGSATCSETSAGASCCWGTCRGGEGTSCVWTSGEEGDDATWIGDAGWGGEDGAVFWRFGCDLVLLGPFLLAWLGWGASALDVWAPLVLADLPVCCYNNQNFMSKSIKEYWWNFAERWNYRWSSCCSRCALKGWYECGMKSVQAKEIKGFYLESLC